MNRTKRPDAPSISDELRVLVSEWRLARDERLGRNHLERGDFDALRDAGFLQAVVPEELGGTWAGATRSVRGLCDTLRLVGAVDPSVALVSAMHPAVLAFWLTVPAAVNENDDQGWDRQRRAVLSTAKAGQRWGTLTSEPGTGGDILRTRAVAVPREGSGPLPGKAYAVSGDKHFGSGMGITDWMVTTALPEGESEPAMFVLDVRDRPWDGSAGLELLTSWDGAGMAATQSHSFRLDGMPATRYGLARPLGEIAGQTTPFILTLFTAVALGVLDEAVSVARECLERRVDELRSYERVEWVRAEQQHWLAEQALEGCVRAVESGDDRVALHAALRAKQSVAELAESALTSLGRVLGGRSLSLASPFSRWSADVRALGYLRPPWGLACDQLLATSWTR